MYEYTSTSTNDLNVTIMSIFFQSNAYKMTDKGLKQII